jgi:hypothetical protein
MEQAVDQLYPATPEDLPQSEVHDLAWLLFSENWEENLNALAYLRVLLKSNYNEFKSHWENIYPRVVQLCLSIRSAVSKNALNFVAELVSEKREGFETADLLTFLLSKSANEKSFLKSEITNAIENLCVNYPSLNNCQRIVEQSHSKSANVAKVSLKYIEEMVFKLTNEEMLQILIMLMEGKRQEHTSIARKIVINLSKDWEGFEEKVEEMEDKEKKWVRKLSEKKENNKPSLKEMIRMQQNIGIC